jgi:hypothetical protein
MCNYVQLYTDVLSIVADVYWCVYVYNCTYIYTYIHTLYIYIIYIYICIYIYIYLSIYLFIQICTKNEPFSLRSQGRPKQFIPSRGQSRNPQVRAKSTTDLEALRSVSTAGASFGGAQKHPKPMGYCWITMVNKYWMRLTFIDCQSLDIVIHQKHGY